MRLHSVFDRNDRTLILRLIGGLTITLWLSCAGAQEHDCIQKEEISTTMQVVGKVVGPDEKFNITCCVRNSSSCLEIELESPESDNITVLDNDTIQGTHFHHTEGSYIYGCKCNGNKFRETTVRVGTSPKNITSFDCLVFNFYQMNCLFTPAEETIFTEHSVFLKEENGNVSQIENYDYNPEFSLTRDQYRPKRRFYDFVFNSTNEKGFNIQNKQVDQYSIAKPQLQDIKFTNIDNTSAKLSWNIPNYAAFENYTNGLTFNISLKAEKFDFFEKVLNNQIQNDNDYFWVEFSDLNSFVTYKVHLCAKANSTANTDRMWSEKFEESFTTLSSAPKPPKIDIGNFYIEPEEKIITLFWQQIPEYEHNGPNFTNIIDEITENGHEIQRNYSIDIHTNNSALIHIDWNNTSQYEFKLKSQNKAGSSSHANLKIAPRSPSFTHKEQERALTKLYYNQNYMVSWLKPKKFNNFSHFTLYWCNAAGTDSLNKCTGPINFMTLEDRNALNYTTEKINTRLNFALSENYYNNYSSGMLWAKCVPDVKDLRIELNNNVTMATEDSIIVQWIKECWQMAIIEKYIVIYCESDTNYCADEDISYDAESYKINKLKPSSSYKIRIKAILRTGRELISEPIDAKTEQENQTIKISIIAIVSIIGIALLIVLARNSQRRTEERKKIDIVLPTISDDEHDVKKTKSNINDTEHQRNVYKPLFTKAFEKVTTNCQNLKTSQIISKDNYIPSRQWEIPATYNNNTSMELQELATSIGTNGIISKATDAFSPNEDQMEISYTNLTPNHIISNHIYLQPEQVQSNVVTPTDNKIYNHEYVTPEQVQSNNCTPMACVVTPSNDQTEKSPILPRFTTTDLQTEMSYANMTPRIVSEHIYVTPQQLKTISNNNTSMAPGFTPTNLRTQPQNTSKHVYVTPEQVQSNIYTPMACVVTPTDDQTEKPPILPRFTTTDIQTEMSYANVTPRIVSQHTYVTPQQLRTVWNNNTHKPLDFTPADDQTENDQEIVQLTINNLVYEYL